MSELLLPMRGVETIDTLRAENITLKIQNSSQLQELLDLKHALNLAEARANPAGLKQRVVIKKPLGGAAGGSKDAPGAGGNPKAAAEALWQHHLNTEGLAADAHYNHNELVPAAAAAGLDGVLVALEQQLRAKTDDLKAAADENLRLKESAAALRAQAAESAKRAAQLEEAFQLRGGAANGGGRGGSGASSSGAAIVTTGGGGSSQAYLMQQIQFLHEEVERLESELRGVRERAAEELRAVQANATAMIQEREAALRGAMTERNRLRSGLGGGAFGSGSGRLGVCSGGTGEDLFTRCSMLESQLAAALSEKTAANAEKYEALAKIRKLETSLKERRAQSQELQKAVAEESGVLEKQRIAMQDAIAALAAEKAALQAQVGQLRSVVEVPRHSSSAQCDDPTPQTAAANVQTEPPPSTFAAGCQVNTIHHFADAQGESVQSIAHALESKCAELETARGDLERLVAVHKETLDFFEVTKRRLADEIAQRKLLQEDNEKLGLQVRSLQQQASQLQAAVRERENLVREAEAKMQQALSSDVHHAEERRKWEEQAKAAAVDMQHLVANQNIANQQIGRLTSENDTLREQIQTLMQREAQANYSLRAKDVELGELLHAYQQATQEVQGHVNNKRTIEQECENLRALCASKEERIVNLSEQVAHLHQREQQLSIDLQSFDFETAQLHRKLVHAEAALASQRGQVSDLQATVAAGERVHQEMDRHAAELLKQLVIKDNENHLLRARCDQLEQEHGGLMAAHRAESARLRELEDQNARLVVKNIMGSNSSTSGGGPNSSGGVGLAAAEQLQRTQRELEEVKTSLQKTTEALRQANLAIQSEQKMGADLEKQVATQRKTIAELERAKADLQQLLLEQSKTLEQLTQ